MRLQDVMPQLSEFPPHISQIGQPGPWVRDTWWNFYRKAKYRRPSDWACRLYLNGLGTDHELRFIVWDVRSDFLPCEACNGAGRLARFALPHRPSLFGELPAEVVDSDGMLPCLSCSGGNVKPLWGASNDFCRVTGSLKHRFGHRLGARGLAEPSKEDVLEVARWCDEMVQVIYGRA